MSLKEFSDIANKEYEYGFKTDIKTELIEKGLNEDIVRKISAKNNEPDFILEFRLKAYKHWLTMEEPDWALLNYPKIDYQDLHYYAAPEKPKEKLKSMDDVDPELKRTFEKLGIPLNEQKKLANVAVDAIFDSVSVATTYKDKLLKHGVVFCPFSEAVEKMINKMMTTTICGRALVKHGKSSGRR